MSTPETNPGIDAGARHMHESMRTDLIGWRPWESETETTRAFWRRRFERSMDAAFSTGAIGMYEKARGVPLPVDIRIMVWLEACCVQVDSIKKHEATVSKRLVLKTLYNLAESADHAVRDARKHNANIKS